jgi:hypothetical protein
MKNLTVLLVFFLLSCNKQNNPQQKYFNQSEQDMLLINIITLMAQKPAGANDSTKFEAQYKDYYERQKNDFIIKDYFIDKDSTHYYFLIRPVANLPYKRGVIGKFKLAKSMKPIDFEEIVNTPHLKESEVIERGHFLFTELIKTKDISKYYALKQYVEWPDANLYYEKKTNQWLSISDKMSVLSLKNKDKIK